MTFTISTIYAQNDPLDRGKNLNIPQILTGLLDLSIIAAVMTCAALALANNAGMVQLPGLGSISNPVAAIMFGSAGGLLMAESTILWNNLDQRKNNSALDVERGKQRV